MKWSKQGLAGLLMGLAASVLVVYWLGGAGWMLLIGFSFGGFAGLWAGKKGARNEMLAEMSNLSAGLVKDRSEKAGTETVKPGDA